MPDDVYTHGHEAPVLRSHTSRTIENSAAYLAHRLDHGQALLDVGCGPGTITVEFADRVAPGRVIGLDRDEGVLATASVRAGDRTNVSFRTGDVYALAFDDASFDVVHAHQVLQHLSDPVAALREMRRVCRPGGTVAVRDADYAGMFWAPHDDHLSRWLDIYRAVARRNGAEPDAGRFLHRWALASGATAVAVSGSLWTFATPDERAWWGSLWADRTTKTALAEQAIDHGIATRNELEACAAAFHRWAEADDGLFAVPHGEVLIAV